MDWKQEFESWTEAILITLVAFTVVALLLWLASLFYVEKECHEYAPDTLVKNLPVRCLEYWENRSGQED